MNESFSDLNVLGDFTMTEDPLAYYNSLNENCQKGYIVASGLGGGTAYTEFEAISGCTEAFIQGSAYARYVLSDTPSLVSTLKSLTPPDGYATLALHPEEASNYYRNRAYPLLGINESLFIPAFLDSEHIWTKVTDAGDYKLLIEKYEEMKRTGNPAFILNVTIQNHGSYRHADEPYKQSVSITSFDTDHEVTEFLSLMKMSDNALKDLLDYFSNVDHPVVILLFGDHQPGFDDTFYQQIFHKESDELTLEEELRKHITPCLIWANYDIPEKDLGVMSPNQLSPALLRAAGLPLTGFNKYVEELGNTLPVIQTMGYVDKNGTVYSYSEQSPYMDLINEYEIVQYNYLHDTKNRLDQYYYLKNNGQNKNTDS